jgi:hypothetical protein
MVCGLQTRSNDVAKQQPSLLGRKRMGRLLHFGEIG